MSNKPKITIKNFSGMGDDGVYYLEGMSARKIQGQGILTPSWWNQFRYSEGTTGFTNMEVIKAFDRLDFPSTGDIVGIDGTGEIVHFDDNGVSADGIIHTVGTPSNNPDLITTKNNNLLYTSAQYLGIGRTFTATGGSTTTIVDSTTDFTALGYADGDTLYNFTNGEEYTIDTGGVGTTTLTLVTGTACNSGDKFIVFDDNWKDLVETSASQIRQIKLLGDEYWVLANDNIASLNVDESTFSATAKEIPDSMEAKCFDTNQDRMLVGAEFNEKGTLLLWDTYSDGYLSIIEVDKTPDAIRAYSNGWVVVIGARLYFTDGYQLKLIARYPDSYNSALSVNANYNSIDVIDDKVLVASAFTRYNRMNDGIMIYDMSTGWTFAPFTNSSNSDKYVLDASNVGAVKVINTGTSTFIFTAFDAGSESTNQYCINRLGESGSTDEYSAIFYIKLPNKMKINTIELNLGFKYDAPIQITSSTDATVKVNYGDARRPLYDLSSVGAGSTTTVINNTNGASLQGYVGQQIRMMNDDVAGERRYIDSIANAGTANEAWTLSSALSATPASGVEIQRTNLYKTEIKTITNMYMPDNLTFNVSDFYSDKLFIEIIGGTERLDIHSINIY